MKKADLSELWEELRRSTTPRAKEFRMRQWGSSNHTRSYAAVWCPEGAPSFIIEVTRREPRIRFAASSTKAFSVDYRSVEGLPTHAIALVLTLHNDEFADLFAILCTELGAAVSRTPDAAAVPGEVSAVLERWRAFLQRRSALLTQEEVRGLIGELVTLARLITLIGGESAVAAWRGPIGGVRDFESEAIHAETKTYTPSAGAAVFISDPLQLEAPVGCTLKLVCVAIDQSPSGAPLVQYVLAVESLLRGKANSLELFRQRIASAGFIPSMAEALPETFVAFEPRVFEVGDGFPRILPGSVPLGVRSVRFAVELAGLGAFAVETDSAIGGRSRPEHPVPLS